jgi:protein TonB
MHGGAGLAGIASLEDRRLRLLGWALLGSLVLHALILLLLPILRNVQEARVAPPPITAHLAKPVPPKPAPPEPPKTEPLPPQPRQAARPLPRPAPQPAPAPVLSAEPAKAPAEPALTVPPAQPQPAVLPSAPQAARTEPAPAAASGPDPGSVARFRLELMEIARRYKRYPRIAQDNNWEGRVELRIAFAESGAMSSLAVRKSAGHTVLDEEAQAMIRSALPHVVLPPSLRGKAFTLDIPVDFSLKDER